MYKLHQAKKKTDYPTTRLLPLNGTIHVRLRKMAYSPLCFKNMPSQAKKVQKNIPKNLTFGFRIYIFAVLFITAKK